MNFARGYTNDGCLNSCFGVFLWKAFFSQKQGRFHQDTKKGYSTPFRTVFVSVCVCVCVCVCVFVAKLAKFRVFEQKKSRILPTLPSLKHKISPEKSTVGRRNFLFGWPFFFPGGISLAKTRGDQRHREGRSCCTGCHWWGWWDRWVWGLGMLGMGGTWRIIPWLVTG